MPRPRPYVPQLKKHKASGRAYVVIGGRFIYLGRHGTVAANAEYDRVIAEWLAAGRPDRLVDPTAASVAEVCAAFWRHAKATLIDPDGTPRADIHNVRQALRPLRDLYGDTLAAQFGPRSLKAIREVMIGKGWARPTINRRVGIIRQAFRLAVEDELVPGDVWHALRAVKGLEAGSAQTPRTFARFSEGRSTPSTTTSASIAGSRSRSSS